MALAPPNRPEHAGLLDAGTDDSLTAGFDHTRADREVLAAEFWVAHALCVSLKVGGLGANLLGNFRIGGDYRTKRPYQLFDFSRIESSLLDLHPSFLLPCVVGIKLANRLP